MLNLKKPIRIKMTRIIRMTIMITVTTLSVIQTMRRVKKKIIPVTYDR